MPLKLTKHKVSEKSNTPSKNPTHFLVEPFFLVELSSFERCITFHLNAPSLNVGPSIYLPRVFFSSLSLQHKALHFTTDQKTSGVGVLV